ncbi:hypothetical protein NDU88_002442 [Pleurodeles waltl]|uniref:Secreted protein n=1 Tax=Pleurodeles waltl TaxID=8319 RepID=A0AAV7PBN4_PLEWA|nr:hypothetical protein NDU88_002442 [Pleurodeles waltl]
MACVRRRRRGCWMVVSPWATVLQRMVRVWSSSSDPVARIKNISTLRDWRRPALRVVHNMGKGVQQTNIQPRMWEGVYKKNPLDPWKRGVSPLEHKS